MPAITPAGTDGRWFSALGIQTYGYLPMNLPPEIEFMSALHAADERIPVECMNFGTDVMFSLLQRFGEAAVSTPDPLRQSAEAALDLAARQLRNLVTNHPDHFPLYTEGGKWLHGGAAWTNWCEGFLPGQLWLVHQQTGDPWFRERAIHYCRLIEHRVTDTSVHDLGFLFWSSWKRWYDQDGDEAQRRVLIEAGRTAGSRFREQGAYLPSFVGPQSLFIDIMMNIGIIFYAARENRRR